jgi:hypothetical protein
VRYFRSRWFKTGFWISVLGGSPLFFIIIAAAVGLWPDPNPNPVGPGLLFAFTFWPGVICMIIGAIRIHKMEKP